MKESKIKIKKISMMLLTMLTVVSISCNNMFDNVEKYAANEVIYADKLDGIIRVQIGYERVEIDLMQAGRIPASQISTNKAKKTVIECADFTEPGNRRVIDSVCSWVNVTGLTQLKTYQLTIYTEDVHGNRSLPLKAEVIPYTSENLGALALVTPSIIESKTAALVEWQDRISANTHTVYRYSWQYTDKDGILHEGKEKGDMPSFFVENVERGTDIPITVSYRIIPTIVSFTGTYTPILDSLDWQQTVMLRISENSEAAIFLRSPAPIIDLDLDADGNFPLTFSWMKVPEVTVYALKISNDPLFPVAATLTMNMGSADEYVMDETQGLDIINSFVRARQSNFYWTVTPVVSSEPVRTQSRRINANRSPTLIGRWLFDNEANLGEATVGQDLIPVGSGFSVVSGPTATKKAVRVDKGSFFRCRHGLVNRTSSYTIKFYFKFPNAETHTFTQTDPTNVDGAGLMLHASGYIRLDGIGNPNVYHSMGPNQWHEIVLVSSGTSKTVYVNGENAYTTTNSHERYLLDAEGILFFADNAGRDNAMEISEISFWDLDLTENEVLLSCGLRKVSRQGWTVPFDSGTRIYPGANERIDYLIDDEFISVWCSPQNEPAWAVIDLGRSINMGRIVAHCINWTGANPRTIQVLTGSSPDPNGTWTLAGQVVREGQSWDPWGICMIMYDSETPVVSRYLKFYMPDSYGGFAPLSHICVYEKVE